MKTDKARETAKNLVGLYGTAQAIRIVSQELETLIERCDFLNEVFANLTNLGTEVSER